MSDRGINSKIRARYDLRTDAPCDGYGADIRSRTSFTAKVFHKRVVEQPAPPCKLDEIPL